MSDPVKDIGCRQAYDILQSRKPRAACADYGDFGFRPDVGRAHRLAGLGSECRNVTLGGGVQRSRCAGSALETVAGAIGGGASASNIVAGSTRLSERGEAGPYRVMTWSSRSLE